MPASTSTKSVKLLPELLIWFFVFACVVTLPSDKERTTGIIHNPLAALISGLRISWILSNMIANAFEAAKNRPYSACNAIDVMLGSLALEVFDKAFYALGRSARAADENGAYLAIFSLKVIANILDASLTILSIKSSFNDYITANPIRDAITQETAASQLEDATLPDLETAEAHDH
ncbi:MAG: hypothetical protein Q7V63_07830 [Gammaproteobacteria bacterium]|nr:hypothetical protein [Gammaproteobacteria bacterium]